MDLDITELKQAYDDQVRTSRTWRGRQDTNWKARYNVWAGQSPDGRKWKSKIGKQPFPWDGAFDSRVPVIDAYVNEDVDAACEAFWGSQLRAYPIEHNDNASAATSTNLIRHLIYNEMSELDEEVELGANYYFERGALVIYTYWEREIQIEPREFTLQDIAATGEALTQQGPDNPEAMEAGQQILEFVQAIEDPNMHDAAVDLCERVQESVLASELEGMEDLPEVSRSTCRRFVKDMHRHGVATMPTPVMKTNRPMMVSLRPNWDFFCANESSDIQRNKQVFYREMVPESTLRGRVYSHGYDEAWVERVIETANGKVSVNVQGESEEGSSTRTEYGEDQYLDYEDMFEVVHAFSKAADEDGVPRVTVTVFSYFATTDESGNPIHAKHDTLDYAHGDYPFVYGRRERLSRRLDDSRGYGEALHTLQDHIKIQWDARSDRTSLATLPPLLHPAGRAPSKWGPAVRVPYVNANDYRYAEVPKYDPGSEEFESKVRWQMDRWVGRPVDGVDPIYARMRMRRNINRWLKIWQQAITQAFQLCQQYMPEEFYYRVVGSDKAKPIRASKEDIRGKFDLHLTFNTLHWDPEHQTKMLDFMKNVITGLDSLGSIDRHEALVAAFEIVDPNLGERLIMPQEAASYKEITDERNILSQMLNGIFTDVSEGQNYRLRSDVLKNELQQNPVVMQRIQQSPEVQQLIEKRLKQLEHQVVQHEVNPNVGRKGA